MTKRAHNRTFTAADDAAAVRLRALWESRPEPRVTQQAVADLLDGSQGLVSQYLNGKIALNYRAVLAFARALDCDPALIRDDLPEQTLRSDGAAVGNADDDWADVRGYAQSAGLGAGTEPQEYAETHALKFRSSSLSRKRLNPSNLAVYYGAGDSMWPRIRKGDAILFDTSDTRPVDGAIFVVEWRGEVFVKRCEIVDGLVLWRSDNPTGDHQWNKPKVGDNPKAPVSILGRVRWLGSWED